MSVIGIVIWTCAIVVFANIAAFALFVWRARQSDDEPTEIGMDYLPADPARHRDMQDR
jgi:hypothetical protein